MEKVRYALLSVSDKSGIVELAAGLSELGINIISTGGTGAKLKEAGIPVIDITEVTGYPEMMDGRVKTLHPAVHGGILARRDKKEHLSQLQKQGIKPIDLVVVNLYPFAETIAQEEVTLDQAIEQIDIGGPTMIRSAAKNCQDVGVVVDSGDYDQILTELRNNQTTLSQETKLELAQKAFEHTAKYDHLIQDYLFKQVEQDSEEAPNLIRESYQKVADLRYGENPHQQAAFYQELDSTEPSVATAQQLHGKELSFNNINDTNAALELVKEFSQPAAAVIKHANPCGVATAEELATAFQQAYSGDPASAYGSIVALNREVDLKTAEEIAGPDKFVEVVIAPSFSSEALEVLQERWESVRLLEAGELAVDHQSNQADLKKVVGGLLVQDRDLAQLDQSELEVVTEREPTDEELADLLFSWQVVKHVKSNAIVIAKEQQVVGVGAGQMSRVDAMMIAGRKAESRKQGAVVASDAFFPFADSIEQAAQMGIKAIIQPGGSIRDEEVIAAANKHNISMVLTGQRHFKH
ncbi:MAG: bifunctional phosphoribosylaminoimidazolecarboxamide formyltransferase/IMP cyclohydrolase [Bacillota bacterium]